jgi:hypothetical protein
MAYLDQARGRDLFALATCCAVMHSTGVELGKADVMGRPHVPRGLALVVGWAAVGSSGQGWRG